MLAYKNARFFYLDLDHIPIDSFWLYFGFESTDC